MGKKKKEKAKKTKATTTRMEDVVKVPKKPILPKVLSDYSICTIHLTSIGGFPEINSGDENTDYLTKLLQSRRLLPQHIIGNFDYECDQPSKTIIKGSEAVDEIYYIGDKPYIPGEFNKRLTKKPARETIDGIYEVTQSYFRNMHPVDNERVKDKSIYWMTFEDLAGFYFKSARNISGSNQVGSCRGFHIDTILKPANSTLECHLSDAFIEGRLTLAGIDKEVEHGFYQHIKDSDTGMAIFNLSVGLTFVYGSDYKLTDLIIHGFYTDKKRKRHHIEASIVAVPDLLMLEILNTKCFVSTRYSLK